MHIAGFCFLSLIYAGSIQAYSKYGRTCKDIGCLSSEECIMETDPCSYYQRQNECGSYPTCKARANAGPRTCKDFVCPPSQVCRMDGSRPRCYDDHSKAGRVGYETSELKDNPSGGNLYPNIARGETTPRPNVAIPQPSNGGMGYQGGQIGSGYPGYPNNNQQQQQPRHPYQNPTNGGYPQQQNGGYPNYPGYNNGYQQQGGGYPQQGSGGYPQQGYPNNYYPQNGYQQNPYQQNPYQQNRNSGSQSGGFVDKLTDALKSYGTGLLKNAIKQRLQQNFN